MATASFDSRLLPVPAKDRGLSYQGRVLGGREDALWFHLVKRVVRDGEWMVGTSERQYLGDLRRAIRDPAARLAVYERRGGNMAVALVGNVVPPRRLGPGAKPWLLIVYSADRGMLVSGYQTYAAPPSNIPGDALWLN